MSNINKTNKDILQLSGLILIIITMFVFIFAFIYIKHFIFAIGILVSIFTIIIYLLPNILEKIKVNSLNGKKKHKIK